MQDTKKYHKEQFEKFNKEVREVLKPLYLPNLLEISITYAICKIHMEHVKEETNYVFNSVKKNTRKRYGSR